MAIDPNKLASFANGPKPGTEEVKNGNPGLDDEGDDDMLEGGPGRYGELIPLLEQHVAELESACDELDVESLKNVEAEMSPEDQEILREGYAVLPEDLKEKMDEVLGGISLEEANELAEHLSSEDMIMDPERTAGYLVRLGALIEAGPDEDEEDDESGRGDEEEVAPVAPSEEDEDADYAP